MDFLSNLAKGGQDKPTSDPPAGNPDHKPASTSDLISSAKVVAEAAQAQFNKDPGSYDKAKAASAAADLLDAASEYAKLDDKQGVGKYVDQAEDYLRKYGHPSQPTSGAAPAVDSGAQKPPESAAPAAHDSEGKKVTAPASEGGSEGGGFGDYMKTAEGFLNKQSGGDGPDGAKGQESEGGYGDLMKKAGSFLGK